MLSLKVILGATHYPKCVSINSKLVYSCKDMVKKRLHNMKLMSDPESEAARKKALAAIDRGHSRFAVLAIVSAV